MKSPARVMMACVPEATRQRWTGSTLVALTVLACGAGVVGTTVAGALVGGGYLLFGVTAGCLALCVRRLHLARSIGSAVDALRDENAALREQMGALEAENARLADLEGQLRRDLLLLRNAIGAVGAQGDDVIRRLRAAWADFDAANTRHASLLSAQARLQLVQILQHFDNDTDAALSAAELGAACAYLRAAFPHGDVDALMRMAARRGVSAQDLEACLLSGVSEVASAAP